MASDKSDKYIKETLHDYESSVDAEALWQAVKPSRRRRAGWWWFSGVLLLIFGASAWLWLHDSAVTPADSAGIQMKSNNAKSTILAEERNTSATTAEEGTDYSSEASITPTPADASLTTIQAINSRAETTALNEHGFSDPSSNDIIDHQINPSVSNSPANPSIDPLSDSQIAPSEASDQAASPIADLVELNQEGPSTPNDESSREPSALSMIATMDAVSVEEAEELDTPSDRLTVNGIPTLTFPLPSRIAEQFPLEQAVSAPVPQVNRRVSPWSAQLNGGIFRLSRSFTINDSLSNDQLDFRRQTEQPLEAVSAELSLVYEHPSQFRFRTGLGWTSINTVFETEYISSQVDSVMGVQAIYVTPEGDSSTVEGMIAAYHTILYRKKHYNRIQHWDIPLLAGYQWAVGSWQFLLEGGVRFNLTQQVSGEILDPELNLIDLSTTDRFETRVGLSYQAGVGVGYALSPRLSLRADMNLRYFPKDFTQSSTEVGERYQLLGGQLGLQYRF